MKINFIPQMASALAVATIIAATPFNSAQAASDVPFKGSWNTFHHDTSGSDPELGPVIGVTFEGEGRASHLGRASVFCDDQVVSLVSGEITATFTLVAGNGDTVHVQWHGHLVGFDPVAQRSDFAGTFQILGG